MKKSFIQYLIEEEGQKPNFAPCIKNLTHCLANTVFLYRGSDSSSNFGEKEKRESRNSLTNSNMVMNFTSLYAEHLPSRKKSFFATNSIHNAYDFGDAVVLIPHDDVTQFATIPNDFNLQENKVLEEIRRGWNLSGLGFTLAVAIRDFNEDLNTDESRKLYTISTKITHETEVSKADFEEYSKCFADFFSSERLKQIPSEDIGYDERLAMFVWEVVSEKYDGDFLRFLKAAFNAGHNGVEVTSFEEMLKRITSSDELFEIWFEGKCSFFSIAWLNQKYAEFSEDGEGDFIEEANDEEDIRLEISEVFKHLLSKS